MITKLGSTIFQFRISVTIILNDWRNRSNIVRSSFTLPANKFLHILVD